ncbi:MAG TPA: hypothetical protein VHD61_00675 [Lacunisphaera sp.]|nr:hypothetical protein [Lacunisphaera sp.]
MSSGSCHRTGRLVLAGLLLAGSGCAAETYRGFTIDDVQVQGMPGITAILAATREQVDIVHAVGLPTDALALLQGVTFQLVPDGTFPRPTPGQYGNGRVRVSSAVIGVRHKPVLLHELMHAYHDRKLAQGFANPEILTLFRQARGLPAFAVQSHMMQNEKEYFACAATTYLYGTTAQEPFHREKIKREQPALHAYLQKLFGPAAGKYEGSLERFQPEANETPADP